MKRFTPERQPPVININIKQLATTTLHITVEGEDIYSAIDWLKDIIRPYVDPFATGDRCTVECREYKNGLNGKSTSFALKGLSSQEVYNIIECYLES